MHHPTGREETGVCRWGRSNLPVFTLAVCRVERGKTQALRGVAASKLKASERYHVRHLPKRAQSMVFLTVPAFSAASWLWVAIGKGHTRCVACGSLRSGCDEEEKSKIQSVLAEFIFAARMLLNDLIGQLSGQNAHPSTWTEHLFLPSYSGLPGTEYSVLISFVKLLYFNPEQAIAFFLFCLHRFPNCVLLRTKWLCGLQVTHHRSML